MKPFFDKGLLGVNSVSSGSQARRLPKKVGYGVEFRSGRDLKNRENLIFISSGQWAEMPDDGLIDQQIKQINFGETLDPLDIVPFQDQNERITAPGVLLSGEVIRGQTIDYESETSKDGRITIFDLRARGYVVNEEIPYKARGIKAENHTLVGFSVGVKKDPFLDGGESSLGLTKIGFYGISPEVIDFFEDVAQTSDLGTSIDTEDYNENYESGAHGNILYSSKFGTDSIAFYGLLK